MLPHFRTIEMMYKRVGEAIKQAGIDSHPQEWLLFLCPGKREGKGPWLDHLDKPTDDVAKLMRKTRRGPIYVHSKMMIVDDVYIILGSANINQVFICMQNTTFWRVLQNVSTMQRSMSGTRDTEIAVGCYQPHFLDENPFGEVHMFRMSLWAGMLRANDPVFRFPGNLECINKVTQMAQHNWEQYVGPEDSITPGMALLYPISVLPNGFVDCLPGFEEFPDFPSGSKVLGKKSAVLPQKLTT